ncbi:5-hydroxyisourate hydrolase [Streptomyces camponoticapitis]|uniref:5-hydroxyisourate hydrolase n=1 Tax=Streptomyces camponoticapitis TaxID=1616125 RepID=A0ABQ2E170_9ACTN|nr:hydroxyisourate hydrolase [Streptomyces camponoticapitis]GGJ85937.1 5-hydroxyisourate hydrolase [Streptomyces camponoticapitis]
MSTQTTASVSTHILDTSVGRPAESVAVSLSARGGSREQWVVLGRSATDADGRCTDLPALPEGTTHVRLDFETEAYFHGHGHTQGPSRSQKRAEAQQDAPAPRDSGAFFPEVAITFAVSPGEHFHVPLLLNPFGYSVYRGS